MTTAAFQVDQKLFGGGYIFGTQVVAPGGEAPPSIILPSQFATIQEAMVDFTIGTKELRGIFEDPEDVANASRKITGKVTTGRVNIDQLNKLVFGELNGTNFTTGSRALVVDEVAVIPATPGPFVDTLQFATTFFEDKGVRYAGTRIQLQPTSSPTPGVGEYTYNPTTGVYTFNGADMGVEVLISYVYTTTNGHILTVDNLVMGSNVRPVFEMLLQNPNEGDMELLMFACKATKISFPVKQEDYVKMELDFIAFANAKGQVCQWLSSF